MKNWYKVNCPMAHQGAGNQRDTTNYVYAQNILEVLSRYRKMPGVKRDRHVPTIIKMNESDASRLEEEIIANKVPLDLAKRTWYFGTRRIR